MKRRIIAAVALTAALTGALLVLAGCTKSGGSGGAKLVYWSMWNEAEPQGQVIARAAEAFTKETGIAVDINFNGREIRKTLQPALDAGETIDLFDEDIERVANTWGNYLLPLDTYVAKSYSTTGGKPYGDVINKTLLTLARDLGGGQVKNIPYQPSAFVTMYNKDLFEKAGITSAPKTGTELLEACAKLKAIGITGITVDDAYMAAFFGYSIDRLVGADATLAMVKNNDFSGPQVLAFGQLMEMMVQNGFFSQKAASNIYPAGQVEEIATGKVAMYLNGTWLPNEIKGNAPNMKWGAFAWPALGNGDGPEANNFGSQSFGINKNTKYPEEAFRFVVWLTTGTWDATLAQESIGIPMGNDSAWPDALAEAKVVVDSTTKRLPWAVGMEDSPDINAKIKENFAKLIMGTLNATQFAEAMAK
ncbi:MAG: extracellular solute-binding protein [Spirochaetaceae bacterium]|jgi:raffinose/stachyose/melibiose transport system substrate-binding protein|nr:extracellular solute-binding protein [Spirochaetaceae bacterium]